MTEPNGTTSKELQRIGLYWKALQLLHLILFPHSVSVPALLQFIPQSHALITDGMGT